MECSHGRFFEPTLPGIVQYTAQKSVANVPVNTCQQFTLESSGEKNEEKTKYKIFYEDSESVFGFSIGCTVSTK